MNSHNHVLSEQQACQTTSASLSFPNSRGLNFPAAKRILEEGMACDVIRIRGMIEKKERFAKRRQRILGNKGARMTHDYSLALQMKSAEITNDKRLIFRCDEAPL